MPLTISFPLNPTEGQVYIFTGTGFSAVYTFKNGIWTTGTGITGMLASDLIGTTLAPNVVISSLTSVGTLTGLTVTNPIVGNITGNAATATNLQSILPILRGGTGQNSPARGLNALLPTQTGNSGKFLRTDAINASWSHIATFADESLTGEVTTVGLTSTISNNAVINKVLTGYVSGAGTITATDTVLQAIQKLSGNAGVAITAGTLTGATLANNVVNSSLTSVGTLTNLSVSNTIAANTNTASQLLNTRTISLGGEATGNTNFDGSNNVTITTTIPLLDGGNY